MSKQVDWRAKRLEQKMRSLPLAAFALYCGHLGRDYGVQRGDVIFCESCGSDKRVKRIIST